MNDETLEAMARFLCEAIGQNPDASLDGAGYNLLWQEMAQTVVKPMLQLAGRISKGQTHE